MLNRVSRKGAKFCSQTIRQAESSTRKVIKHDSTKKLAKFAKTKFINHIGMVQNMLLEKSDNKDSFRVKLIRRGEAKIISPPFDMFQKWHWTLQGGFHVKPSLIQILISHKYYQSFLFQLSMMEVVKTTKQKL